MKLKKDQYQRARGGRSALLQISCESCGEHVCFYQKDGPGPLKRMYADRMMDRQLDGAELKCGQCGRLLGVQIIYEKEQRPAYRLFVGAVIKRRAMLSDLDATEAQGNAAE